MTDEQRKLIFSARRKDFRIDTFASGGPGGQHQNKTQSGVRITHAESGISAECRESRSQHQNLATAFRRVARRLAQWAIDRDRGAPERPDLRTLPTVRTYHGADNRVKDHRTGVVRPYQPTIDGDLDAFITAGIAFGG